jgi:hypothetical protein
MNRSSTQPRKSVSFCVTVNLETNGRGWSLNCPSSLGFSISGLSREIQDIKYAKPGPDAGAEAKAILADLDYARRVVVEMIIESESAKQVGDIIKGIYGSIQQCVKENMGSDAGARGIIRLGRSGTPGWDWLELTDIWRLRRTTGERWGQRLGRIQLHLHS